MNRERLLTIAVVVLLILNISVVGYLIFGNQQRPDRPELFDLVVRELEMTPDQREKYAQLRDQHRLEMERINAEFAHILQQYFQLLSSDESKAKQEEGEAKIAALEKHKASITLAHFRAVKEICNPQQQERFNQLIPEITRMMSRPRSGPPHRK